VGSGPSSDAPRANQKQIDAARPALVVDGEPIRWEAIRDRLAEAAGASVLEEVVLDRRLADAAARAGVSLSAADVEEENRLYAAALAEGAAEGRDADAERLLERVRRRRGLGEARFSALTRRTALLRKLVQPDVEVSDAALREAYALRHGPRYEGRLITTATLREASEARAAVADGTPFTEAAARRSTDVSAERGGLLEPISAADPTYPKSIRDALQRLEPGEVSLPIALDDGYAVLKLERVIPPDGVTLEEARPRLRREVRLRQERILMNELARELLDDASVTVFDPALRWAWETRRPREGG